MANYTVTVTGSGTAHYCYAFIDGVEVYTAQTLNVPHGSTITFVNTATNKIRLNGEDVADKRTGQYVLTVTNAVTIEFSGSGFTSAIDITYTPGSDTGGDSGGGTGGDTPEASGGSHKALVSGTVRSIKGGKAMVGGTVMSISKGKAMVGGTVYEITFGSAGPVTINITGFTDPNNLGYTWVSFAGQTQKRTGSWTVDGPVEIKVHCGCIQGDTWAEHCYIEFNGERVAAASSGNYQAEYTFTMESGTVTIEYNTYSQLAYFASITTS